MKEIIAGFSSQQRRWLDLAVKTAELSECQNRHGAVLIKGGNCIALGRNKMKNDPDTIKNIPYNYSRHAEIDALARAGNCKNSTLYIARINNKGDEMLSRPCTRCMSVIIQSGVKQVIYTI